MTHNPEDKCLRVDFATVGPCAKTFTMLLNRIIERYEDSAETEGESAALVKILSTFDKDHADFPFGHLLDHELPVLFRLISKSVSHKWYDERRFNITRENCVTKFLLIMIQVFWEVHGDQVKAISSATRMLKCFNLASRTNITALHEAIALGWKNKTLVF